MIVKGYIAVILISSNNKPFVLYEIVPGETYIQSHLAPAVLICFHLHSAPIAIRTFAICASAGNIEPASPALPIVYKFLQALYFYTK